MGKHYGKAILARVLEMKAEGRTHREIGELLGYEQIQIKKLVERYNKSQRRPLRVPRRKGRPRTRPMTEQETLQERISELEREVELYRSFLQAVGRM